MKRLLWNSKTRRFVLWLLRFLFINRKRIVCICWGGTKYSCNPKAITDELIRQGKKNSKLADLDIIYAFSNPEVFKDILPKQIKPVHIGTLEYFYYLSTSHFIISNTRFGGGIMWPFPKKKGQVYIQTMHGGHGLKRQELEIKDSLSEEYIQTLYNDASRIDLMLSDSVFWTKLARTIFAFPEGEILEVGLPRNDVFFTNAPRKSEKKKYVIYCPTFRNSSDYSVYGFDVDKTIYALETRFGGEWYVRVHCHPNMLGVFHKVYDFSHPRMIDVSQEDLQEMLVTSDVAVTDYSSAGFEFALSQNPVFLLCKDIKEYDRGLYFLPKSLPFPYAENDTELINNILAFDNEKYLQELSHFNENVVGLKETGHSSEIVVKWMENKL